MASMFDRGYVSPILTQYQAAPATFAELVPRPSPAPIQEQAGTDIRRRYETATAQTAALLAQARAVLAQGLSMDTNAARRLAAQLDAAGLREWGMAVRSAAQQVDSYRASQPAPGGAPLQAPNKVSPLAWTKSSSSYFGRLPGFTFIIKPLHFNDLDFDKFLQNGASTIIQTANALIGAPVSTAGWLRVFDGAAYGALGAIAQGLAQKIQLIAWEVPDGTPVYVIWENLKRPGPGNYPERWARVRFTLPGFGGGIAATNEGFILMQDLVRRMEY